MTTTLNDRTRKTLITRKDNHRDLQLKAHKDEISSLPVHGMSCASCAVSIESVLKKVPGLKDVNVNFATKQVQFKYDPERTNLTAAKKAVQSIGYDLEIPTNAGATDHKDHSAMKHDHAAMEHDHGAALSDADSRDLRWRSILAFALAVPVVLLGMAAPDNFPMKGWIQLVLTGIVLFVCGRNFFTSAVRSARHFRANMDTLVALSTGVAFVYSAANTIMGNDRGMNAPVYYESAAVVVAFILLGKMLEARATKKTSEALNKLMSLQPNTVLVIRNGVEVEARVDSIVKSERIVIRPGGRVPVDGVVASGDSYIDESMMTGEPVPVHKVKGAKVFAGTINQKGSLTIIAEKIGRETLLAQIIRRVGEAQGSKAPVQKLVDKVAGIFVPVVILISIIVFGIWMFSGGPDALEHALLSSITVLIIACPCALGLATPTAIITGMGKGAQNGILIRDAASLERANKLDTIVLDMTGTITEGSPRVTDFIWATDLQNQKELENILFSIERRSEHPLAQAIVDFLKQKGNAALEIENFQSLTGRGVSASVGSAEYFVGSERLRRETKVPIPAELSGKLSKLEGSANVLFFFDRSNIFAAIAVSDPIKEGSKEALQTLRERGIEAIILTGASKNTATAIAKTVGITNVQAELLPSDKSNFVKELQAQNKNVGMVGDGINDSEALAQANVGIAMGKGSDIAKEIAQMTILSSDLRKLPQAIRLSKVTVKTIRQNLFWAFIYNIIAIPIAAGVLYPFTGFLLSPMIAGAAMALSSVSVVTNSLRLKAIKL